MIYRNLLSASDKTKSTTCELPTESLFYRFTLLSYIALYAFYYVAAKATYIRLLHGKIGFLGFFSALAP